MTDDQGGGKPDFLVAGPGEAADVLMVLDEAAAWLQGRGIAQWPPRFEPSWVEAAIGRGETWLVKVGGTVSATVTLDLADPVWDGIAGSALYVHRMAVRRRAAGLGAAVLGWASGVARERGLVSLPGGDYWPALADIPDQKGWRVSNSSDYGPLTTFARGKLDLARIRANWSDILRVVVSIYTGEVRAYDVVRMLQRDGHPTALGEAIAMYGRIPRRSTSARWPPRRPTGATSRACGTCRRAATPSPARRSTARRASCTSATTKAWKTSSASSASS